MIKRLLSFAAIAAMAVSANAEVIWKTGDAAAEGDGTMTSGWGTALVLDKAVFANAKATDVIKITATCASDVQVAIKAGWTDIYAAEKTTDGALSQVLCTWHAKQLKSAGLRISGSGALTVTKVELTEGSRDVALDNAIWIGNPSLKIGNYSPSIVLAGALAGTLKADDVIKVNYVKDASEIGFQTQYISSSYSWTAFDPAPVYSYTDNGASFTMTAEMVKSLEGCQGMVFQGKDITVSSVVLEAAPEEPIDPSETLVLWEGSYITDAWNSGAKFSTAKIKAGDLLRFYVNTADAASSAQALIKNNSWGNLIGSCKIQPDKVVDGVVEVGVTEALLSDAGDNIFVQGEGNLEFTKVELLRAQFDPENVFFYGKTGVSISFFNTLPEDTKAIKVTVVSNPQWLQICDSGWNQLDGNDAVVDGNVRTYPATADMIAKINDKKELVINSADCVVTSIKYTTGTGNINDMEISDNDAPAVYYNLQGIRVANPAQGNIYIKKQGAKATKVIF